MHVGVYNIKDLEVLRIEKNGKKIFAISKNSPFYPDGKGGQLGDRGKIGETKVLFVEEKNVEIYHEIDKEILPGRYSVDIDLERRFEIAQQHTGQHILSAAFVDVAEMNTVSFRMGEDYSTIDLDVPFIDQSVLKEVEQMANKRVFETLKIDEVITDFDGAKNFKLRKPISEKIKGEIRLIKIGDFDTSACGGFHLENTGQVGLIKIIDTEKVKGELTRVYALSGIRALRYFQYYNDLLKNLTKILTSSKEELESRVARLLESTKENVVTLSKLSELYAQLLMKDLPENEVVYLEGYKEIPNFILKYIENLKSKIVIFNDGEKYVILSKNLDCRDIVKKLIERLGGKGGGMKERANYITTVKKEEIIKFLEDNY